MAYVYKHIRNDNGEVFYIGASDNKDGEYKRAYRIYRQNKEWDKIVAETSFAVEIIYDNITMEEAYRLEVEMIAKYKRFKDGGTLANATIGGMGVSGLSGYTHPMQGKNHTYESRLKMSITRTGKKMSEKQRIGIKRTRRRTKVGVFVGNEKLVEYESINMAALATGIHPVKVHNIINGKVKIPKHYGYDIRKI